MGMISNSFPFLPGTVFGVYIAQNYNIPKIEELIDEWIHKAERFAKEHRKPEKARD